MATIQEWAGLAMKRMRKAGLNKPTFLARIDEWEEFKQSGLTVDELEKGMSEIFEKEREVLIKRIKDTLSKGK